MADSKTRYKNKQALFLLSSVGQMQQEKLLCDFTIRVGSKIFEVHRTIVSACSRFFNAMLTHDMKESRESIVDMKNVTADSVEKCIQFMYHGEVDLQQIGDVENVLHAAGIMQLDLLTELCFDHLKQNMSVENIFFIKDLAKTFHNESVSEICNTHMAKHFKEVSKQDGFAALEYEELLEYIRNLAVDKGLMWQAIVRWMGRKKQRKENLLELLKNFHAIHSDMYFILTVVSRNRSVRKSPQCTEYIQNILLSDVESAKKSVTLESCYAMYYIIKNCERQKTNILRKTLKSFMVDNFEEISQVQEWVNIVEDDITTILQDGKLTYSAETIKWDAALKWVKHKSQRKGNFPELLRLMDFDALSDEFIQKNIRKEPLVAESAACMGIVLDAVMNKAGKKLQTEPTAFVTSHENETDRTSSNSYSPLNLFASENPEIQRLDGFADIVFNDGIRGESLVKQDLNLDGDSQSVRYGHFTHQPHSHGHSRHHPRPAGHQHHFPRHMPGALGPGGTHNRYRHPNYGGVGDRKRGI